MLGISIQMRAHFTNISSQLPHPGERGKSRENAVIEFLKKYLPANLGVGTGFVIAANGEVSRQQDIVIFDAQKCPTLYGSDDTQVFPVEGVYAVIEVKSNLDSLELNDCIEKILSVKNLPKIALFPEQGDIRTTISLFGNTYTHFPVIGYVFSFDSIELENLCNQLRNQITTRNLNIDKRIDAICILNRGVIFSTRGRIILPLPENTSFISYSNTENSLLLFYLLLTTIITQAHTLPINLVRYAITFSPSFTPVHPN